jgi:hypothetical protein
MNLLINDIKILNKLIIEEGFNHLNNMLNEYNQKKEESITDFNNKS